MRGGGWATLDPTLPMPLMYASRIGPVSAEYRVDAYYR